MRYEVQQLADGWSGTDATVRTISRLVNESLTDPKVRLLAEHIVRRLPERDKDAEIRAISDYVRRHIRYTSEAVETIKTPRVMVDEIQRYGKAVGDCDDHLTLWLALHRIVGTKADIQVISQRPDGIANHIYGRVWNGHRWIADDTIMKKNPLGWEAPADRVTKRKSYTAPAGPSMIPALDGLGCCGGSCSRSRMSSLPEDEGVGQYVELIAAGIGAATTAATMAAQMAAQKKAIKVQKDAMEDARKQADEANKLRQAEIDSAERIASTSGGGSMGLGTVLGILAVGGAALYLMSD